ncbi:hypothetical protein EC844_13611 [Acinetobacter calcoaceticus]|uniref:DUF3311 domain-containing protein n=1 Tax=Acinetobacter calcoaceticus TaxID=471 RepID=A0A4R1XBB3_ACICA|nr:hypothetical protein EC844_13611 [Acinetobacter calcoaceticus]
MNNRNYKKSIQIKNIFFSLYFLLLLIITVTPNFYIGISGSPWLILGIPLSLFYWFAIAVMLMFGLSVMYLLEDHFGEIPREGEDQ